MSEDIASERLSIRSSARSLKKYGSTSSHVKQAVNVVKHAVQACDTLQGLALRYGVTTEQIRRTNRLWASDSLFLREHLLIPVDGEAGATYNGGASGSNEPALSRGSSVVDRDEEETSIGDFLGKIDSSIAVTKSEVNKCQGNSEFLTEQDGRERRRPAVARLRQSQVNNNVLVVSDTRLVQKMERQQDEIFQL